MADIELLPLELPERFEFTRQEVRALMRDYARANLAPLQAENERLRAEVRDAYAAADSKAGWEWKKRAEQAEARAERLAEALRDARDCAESHLGLLIADNMSGGVEQTKALITKIDAALAQEDRND